ncbi:uncharacterized protein LOC127852340 [Dreissena polymorpha]|nr:uncharacterized protein LOC127852340 [Dreissena polymorpha]
MAHSFPRGTIPPEIQPELCSRNKNEVDHVNADADDKISETAYQLLRGSDECQGLDQSDGDFESSPARNETICEIKHSLRLHGTKIDEQRNSQHTDTSAAQSSGYWNEDTDEENNNSNTSLKLLKEENATLKKTIDLTRSERDKLKRDLSEALSRQILEKPPQEILEMCKKNEQYIERQFGKVQDELCEKYEEVRKLKKELSNMTSLEGKDQIKRELQKKRVKIELLEQQKQVMEQRIHTLKEAVTILEKDSSVLKKSSERSLKLKVLINTEAMLKLESFKHKLNSVNVSDILLALLRRRQMQQELMGEIPVC